MNLAKNLIASTLQLGRTRPPLHKGALFLVPAAPPPSAPDTDMPALVGGSPRFDPELAAMLRALVLVLRPGGALPAGAQAFPVLAGPTLEGWYHVGSQLPWKQHIGVHCVVCSCPEAVTAEDICRGVAEQLAVAGQAVSHADIAVAVAEAVGEGDGGGGGGGGCTEAHADILVRSRGGREDRSAVRIKLGVQATPLPSASLPALAKLRRATIDGGNAGLFVPGDRAAVAAALSDWQRAQQQGQGQGQKRAARGGKGGGGKLLSASPAGSVTATLRMPAGWAWCEEAKMFVRPRLVRQAMRWPPSLATVKVFGALAVFLGLLYLLTMVLMPDMAARAAARGAAQGREGLRKGAQE